MFKIIKSKAFIITAVIILIGVGIYYVIIRTNCIETWKIARQLQKQQQASIEDKEILAQLKKIILLPDEVTPTMAVITDIETLKKQQPVFFNNAKNGDHLVIYPDMAIIYDAEVDKIMKVGPVQTVNPATPAASNPETTAPKR